MLETPAKKSTKTSGDAIVSTIGDGAIVPTTGDRFNSAFNTSTFDTLLKKYSSKITVINLAIKAKLSGRKAKKYLDKQAFI